jgi:hypothetical protein
MIIHILYDPLHSVSFLFPKLLITIIYHPHNLLNKLIDSINYAMFWHTRHDLLHSVSFLFPKLLTTFY